MAEKGAPIRQVRYTQDDGTEARALTLDYNAEADTYNLAVIDPNTYQLGAANDVPADRVS